MTAPDTGSIDGAPARDDALVAAPDMHEPGMPPGGRGPAGPSHIRHKRSKKQTVDPATVPAPAKDASKAELVDYVVNVHGVDRQTAESMNKTQLTAYIPGSSQASNTAAGAQGQEQGQQG